MSPTHRNKPTSHHSSNGDGYNPINRKLALPDESSRHHTDDLEIGSGDRPDDTEDDDEDDAGKEGVVDSGTARFNPTKPVAHFPTEETEGSDDLEDNEEPEEEEDLTTYVKKTDITTSTIINTERQLHGFYFHYILFNFDLPFTSSIIFIHRIYVVRD